MKEAQRQYDEAVHPHTCRERLLAYFESLFSDGSSPHM